MSTRRRIVLIIGKIVGIALLVLAVDIGQDVLQIKPVSGKDIFSIKGRVQFTEKTGEGIWSPKKQVLVRVEDYPALFFIDTKSDQVSEVGFNKQVSSIDTTRLAIHKDQLSLLYTPSTIRLHGLFLQNGKALYTFNDAFQRDKKDRLWLYVQAGICMLAGFILLSPAQKVPFKRVKESRSLSLS